MSVDLNLLEKLVKYSAENDSKFSIFINDQIFNLLHVSIENSPIPVNEPTTRGGVYFSEKFAYKIKGIIEDLSVVPLLTKKMLGPNTEFGELKISCNIQINNKSISVNIFTNLTNSLQTPNSIELSMIIVKLESS
ncbi:MAG: hypothetical protein O2834_03955 [Crenarchaeota archaeon]|nr:hypothetical protein [Thermoproteota archaeon]HJJ21657.1 hypothetical protein [Nitrosopumilus sp.]MDA0853017.1 hypothetical protein [Thermoproteota archaeon]MDA1123368.1 hypothetical protein [Thermoproteota archaeon]HJJ23882.1 hypothetical protein [Nitrosopumilus sp.]